MSGWTHIRDTQRKAKKQHSCFLCAKPIAIGEQYTERFGYCDREAVAMRMHGRCEAVTVGWDQTDWECFSPGDLGEQELAKGGGK